MKSLTFHQRLMIMIGIHAVLLVYAIMIDFTWWYLLMGFAFGKIFNVLGHECGLHRLWAHKSYKIARWKEYLLHIFAIPLLYGSSIVYSGVHRQHHAYSDTERDPHITRPWWKMVFYVRNKKYAIENRFVSDLTRDPLHKWLHRNYFKINLLILISCLLFIGPFWTGWTLSFLVIHNFLAAGAVNVFGHRPEYGWRTFDTDDKSSNNLIIQILTWSEGLHNHHHKNTSRWDYRVNPGEVDIPALVIKYCLKHP